MFDKMAKVSYIPDGVGSKILHFLKLRDPDSNKCRIVGSYITSPGGLHGKDWPDEITHKIALDRKLRDSVAKGNKDD